MSSNEKIQLDIIDCIIGQNKWEPPYTMDMIKYVLSPCPEPPTQIVEQLQESAPEEVKSDNPQVVIHTNPLYLLNTYFVNTTQDSAIDGDAYKFISAIHNEQKNVMIKVTFEAVPRT